MATINLGSIKFKWKGTYAGGTAYTVDDVVEYNGSSYICILASTGNLPTNATYFEQMSQKGTDGTNGTDGTDLTTTLTTQGDLVYRDGSGLARLGAGTSGQVLQTGGTGANPSWGTVSSDFVKLASGTLSGSSTSIDGYFTSDYDVYEIHLTHFRVDTSGSQLWWRFNQGGSALSANNYRWAFFHVDRDNTSTTTASAGSWSNEPYFRNGCDMSLGTDRGSQMIVTLFDPLDTTNQKFLSFENVMDRRDAQSVRKITGGGYYNDGGATAMSGVTFLPQSGNFGGGNWKLYGIKA
jgi:hypothetical protein